MQIVPLPRKAEEFQQPPAPDALAALCRRMLGELPVEAREIGGGYFNNTFVVTMAGGEKFVLRVAPPHGHPQLFSNERYLLRREHALGPYLAGVGPLLPRIVAADFTGELLDRDAVLSAFIAGENWDAVTKEMSAEENDIIWRALGTLVKTIHQTTGASFGWTPPERGHARWSDFVLEAARGLIGDYPRFKQPEEEARAWLAAAEAGAAILDEITTPRLVHGDPWPKNVLIRRGPAGPIIVGLLDHERGLWGDPMNEWVFHGMTFPPAFWETHGPRPTGPAAAFRDAVYGGLIGVQVVLEGVRYHWDATSVRRGLADKAAQMRALLAEVRG